MKLQFSVRTMLLATAFAGIWLGAVLSLEPAFNMFIRGVPGIDRKELTIGLLMLSPVWLPVGVLGYAIGKKSVSAGTLLALVVIEFVALCAVSGIPWHYHW